MTPILTFPLKGVKGIFTLPHSGGGLGWGCNPGVCPKKNQTSDDRKSKIATQSYD